MTAVNLGITTNDILKAADLSGTQQLTSHGNSMHDIKMSPEGSLQTTPLIWRLSLLKYNSRIAQTTQWL